MTDISDLVSTRALILGMVRPDGTIEGAELYDVADACGFTVHQVRLCLARLVKEGMFTQQGRGRKAVLVATARAQRELEPAADFLRLAWAQDVGLLGWDGTWHIVGFTIGEEQRPARNALREHIVDLLSGAPLAGGLYVSPHNWDQLILDTARELDVKDKVVLMTASSLDIGGVSDPRGLAAALWDLDDIDRGWAAFLHDFRPTVATLRADHSALGPAGGLAALVRLVTRWNQVVARDPLLPPELLPGSWKGAKARELLLDAAELVGELRDEAHVPALFSRYDQVMTEVASTRQRGHLRPK